MVDAHGHFMAVRVATKSLHLHKHFFKNLKRPIVFFAQVGRAMAVEAESGRNMRTHSHSKRTNGKYAHSSKISQHNLWLLKGVVNKKPTIRKLPTELPLYSTSSVRQEKSDRSSRAIISVKCALSRSLHSSYLMKPLGETLFCILSYPSFFVF